MNESSTKPVEGEAFLCRALIGLYVFVLPIALFSRVIIGSTSSHHFSSVTAYEILIVTAAFLFSQYCLRLRSGRLLISRRALWLLTAIHSLGAMLLLGYAVWPEHGISVGYIPILFAVSVVPLLLFVSALILFLSPN